MKLNTIQKEGQWSNISDRLNYNFSRIDASIERIKGVTLKLCGYFKTEDKLREAYPIAMSGAKAYVGNSFPYAIYLWDDLLRGWVDSGYTGGEDSVKVEEITHKIYEGDVINNPDEEDLTLVGPVIKFADKTYNKQLFSGLGRNYVRKNIKDGVNVLSQDMLREANTIYHIQYDYDLLGEEIVIPAGSTLNFEGGSLNNGGVVFDDTTISGAPKMALTHFSGVIANAAIEAEF